MLLFISLNLRSVLSASLTFWRIPVFVQSCPSCKVLYSGDKELNLKNIREGDSPSELEWSKKALFELGFEENKGRR